MRLEQLTYFVEAVNRGSINKAAEALYVSQSTVHDALKKLDEELGAVLLNRTHIGVVPTDAGRRFYNAAVDMLESMDDVRRAIRYDSEEKSQHRIAAAITPEFIDGIMPDFMKQLSAAQPHVQLAVRLGDFYECMHMVAEGAHHLDYGFVMLPQAFLEQTRMQAFLADHGLHVEPLCHTRLMVTVSRDSPLAQRNEVSLEEMLTHPAVIYKTDLDTSWHRMALAPYGSLRLGFISGAWRLCDHYIAGHEDVFGFSNNACWPSREHCRQLRLRETLWEEVVLVSREETEMTGMVRELFRAVCGRHIEA